MSAEHYLAPGGNVRGGCQQRRGEGGFLKMGAIQTSSQLREGASRQPATERRRERAGD